MESSSKANKSAISKLLFSKQAESYLFGNSRFRFAATIALLVTLISGIISFERYSHNQIETRQKFELLAKSTFNAIESRLQINEQILLGTGGLFNAGNYVDRGEFAAYTNSLRIDENYPGIQVLGFITYINESEKDSFESSVRNDGFPIFSVHPKGIRSSYAPVLYIEPFSGRNLRAFGYDLFSDSVRKKYLILAKDSNLVLLTEKLTLVIEQDKVPSPGFLMFMPVYKIHKPFMSVEDRQTNFNGWLYVGFRIKDFMHGISTERSDLVDVEIYDGEVSEKSFIYDDDTLHFTSKKYESDKADENNSIRRQIKTAGRTWTLIAEPNEKFNKSLTYNTVWLYIIIIFILSLITFGLTLVMLSVRDSKVAGKSILQVFKTLFNRTNSFYIQLDSNGKILTVSEIVVETLHYSAVELTNKTIFDIIKPIQDLDIQELILDSERKKIPPFNIDLIDKNNKIISAQVTLVGVEAFEVFTIIADFVFLEDKKAIELELKKSKDFYQQIFAAHSTVRLLVDPQSGEIIDVNEAACDYYGYSYDQLLTMNVSEINIMSQVEIQTAMEAAKSRNVNYFNFRHRLANGEIRDVEVFSSPITFGERHLLYSIVHDITEKRNLEREIQNHALKYKMFMQTSSDGIHIVNESGKLVEWNQTFLDRLEYSESEMENLSVSDWDTVLDNSAIQELLNRKTDADESFVTVHRSKSGKEYDVEITLRRIVLDGKRYIYASSHDITKMKQAFDAVSDNEKILKEIISVLPAGVTITDKDGGIVIRNKYSDEIIGRKSIGEHISANPATDWEPIKLDGTLLPHDEWPLFIALKENRAVKNQIFGVRYKDGRIVWINSSAMPLNIANYGIILTFVDVTDEVNNKIEIENLYKDQLASKLELEANQKELIETIKVLEDSENKLREINRTKDKFFSIISHDLRGPFHVFLNLSELIASGVNNLPKEKLQHFAGKLNGALQQQYELLTDLLYWSRLQTGGMTVEIITLLLRAEVNKTIDSVSVMAIEKGLNIVNDIKLEVGVLADENMFKLVLRNLLTNAIKFSYPGGKILIKAVYGTEFVSISVQDFGVGIAPENIEKIFRVDIQHSSEGTAKEKGTGLGLILCREIALRLGGSLELSSELGKGSIFTFSLPYHEI